MNTKTKKDTLCVLPLSYFDPRYDAVAKRQGWALFNSDDVVSIQRIDEQGCDIIGEKTYEEYMRTHKQLSSDTQAINIVVQQAKNGDIMSLLALYLEGRPVDAEVDIPSGLQSPLPKN